MTRPVTPLRTAADMAAALAKLEAAGAEGTVGYRRLLIAYGQRLEAEEADQGAVEEQQAS